MNRPNKIAIGLNAWLTFEQMCKREPLFSEAYLAYPIGQLLATRYGARLVAEYPHPVLSPLKKSSGDKPRLDFAVLKPDGRLELAIETKWLSSSNKLHRDVLRDLVRLELIRHAHSCEAWFIIAGPAHLFQNLVGSSKFQGHPLHLNSKPILPYGINNEGVVRLNPIPRFREKLIKEVLEPFGEIEMRNIIHLTKFGPYPSDAQGKSYVVYLWRLNSRGALGRFSPPKVPDACSPSEIEA